MGKTISISVPAPPPAMPLEMGTRNDVQLAAQLEAQRWLLENLYAVITAANPDGQRQLSGAIEQLRRHVLHEVRCPGLPPDAENLFRGAAVKAAEEFLGRTEAKRATIVSATYRPPK